MRLFQSPIIVGGVCYHFYQQARPPTNVILLVADFDGPEPQKYRVTETVYENLLLALEKYDDVQVVRTRRAFEESSEARAEGEKHKAAIVIWGWYGATAEAVSLSVHFEMLRPPKHMPELAPEVRGGIQFMSVAELENFALQAKLADEMAYLGLFTVGMVRYAVEDWDGAIARFTDALHQVADEELELGQSAVYFFRAAAYNSIGDYDSAIADYSEAIYLQPDFVKAYYNRGLAYIDKGDYSLAFTSFDQATKLDSSYARAYLGRGVMYYFKGEFDWAIADYNWVIQLQPDDVEAYVNRCAAFFKEGDYDQAIADCDRAVQLRPGLAVAYYNRGIAYFGRGDHDRAIAEYDKAIELRPDYAEAYINRGAAHANRDNPDSAIADFDEAIALRPQYAAAYYNRGLVYKQRGEKEEAIADFEKVLELSNDPNLQQRAEEELAALGAR